MNIQRLPAFSLLKANREELDINLNIHEGELPKDLKGFIFFNSVVGSVNSGGLPYPELQPDGSKNPEFGTPLFNSDGMVFRVHFTGNGEVRLKSRLLKTPDYYADEAMLQGSKYYTEKQYKLFPFKNGGIARVSLVFGSRNQVNTAFTPFRLPNEDNVRLLVTFDAGKPYEIDPATLDLLHPIGYNKTWRPAEPSFMKYIFPVIMSSAHPCFDAHTRELFTVNFCPDYTNTISGKHITNSIRGIKRAKADRITNTNSVFKPLKNFLGRSLYSLQAFISRRWGNDPHDYKPNIFLLHWDGEGEIKRFRLVDENGLPIVISQAMHQISISEDYVVLMDTSFKMSLNILVNNPFPKSKALSRFFRKMTTRAMQARTRTFLVKRSDLKQSNTDVKVVAVRKGIPFECVHYNTKYSNPNDEVSFISTHNNALCLAEWTQNFDRKFTNPKEPVDKDQIGMYNGAMDVSGIGKFIIDAQEGIIKHQNIIRETGNEAAIEQGDHKNIGANTWSSGLHTFAGLESPFEPTQALRYVYWQTLGLDDKMQTDFMAYLYANYPHRKVSMEKLRDWVTKGIPGGIICVDTHEMKIVDYYQLPENCHNRSIQYVPKSGSQNNASTREGYLVITLLNPASEKGKFTRELWIFDSEDLTQGPLCKMGAPEWVFAYTLHSTWLPTVESPAQPAFDYDIREDHDWRIRRVRSKSRRAVLTEFMEKNVYQRYEDALAQWLDKRKEVAKGETVQEVELSEHL